jgi:hypothetical protein
LEGLDRTCFGVIVAYNTDYPAQDIAMNRRIHNTFLALTASSVMLAVVLVAGAPAPAFDPGIRGQHPLLAGSETVPGQDTEAAEAASEVPRVRGAHARSRQSVVMPYFSFARRG